MAYFQNVNPGQVELQLYNETPYAYKFDFYNTYFKSNFILSKYFFYSQRRLHNTVMWFGGAITTLLIIIIILFIVLIVPFYIIMQNIRSFRSNFKFPFLT